MNPAYMLRQMNDFFSKYYGIQGHITSKKLIRLANKPDKWELNALNEFEKGKKEIINYSKINGQDYLRLMQPLITEKSCLKCHEHQGYKVGDIRGGISISIPMKSHWLRFYKHNFRNFIVLVIIWFLGASGLTFTYKKLKTSWLKKREIENNFNIQNKEYSTLNEELKYSIQKIAESEEKFKAIANQSIDAIMLSNDLGYFVYANPAFLKLVGYSEEEIYSIKISDLTNENIYNEYFLNKKENIDFFPIRIKLRNKSGNEIFTEVLRNTIIIDNKKVILSTIRDISEQIHKEQELILAKEKAEKSDKLKTEFIHNLSHEIRTPLNGILGFSDLLSKPNLSTEKQNLYIDIIKNSGKLLLKTINDILEISQLETQQVFYSEKTICLNYLLLDLFTEFETKAKNKNLSFYLQKALSDYESIILTDEAKLKSIVKKLLENALKFTHSGFVEFGYTILKENENYFIQIYVKDTGIGIKEEMYNAIFERFIQGEPDISLHSGGLGLGLTIAKEKTKILNAKIHLESSKNHGSTFYLTFEVKNNELTYKNELLKLLSAKNFNKIKILVAEDEETNFLYIESLFTEDYADTFLILHARNGKEAIDICTEIVEIKLVLLDLEMPVLNGFQAAKAIREIKPDLPIIAQTIYADTFEMEKAHKNGFNEIYTKPLTDNAIKKLIEKYIFNPQHR